MQVNRSAKGNAKRAERIRRRKIKEELWDGIRYVAKSKNTRQVIVSRAVLDRELALVKKMNRFCLPGDDLDLFRGVYTEMRAQLGTLKGKNILTVSEKPGLVKFLRDGEGAKVTLLYALPEGGVGRRSAINHAVSLLFAEMRGEGVLPGKERFQTGNFQHLAGQFDCVLSNGVFEKHAFEYSDGRHRLAKPPQTLEEKQDVSILSTNLRNAFDVSENEVRPIKERIDALRNFNLVLKKGGKVIIATTSSSTVFKPREITSTGFRILKLNHPDILGYRRLTVLEKIR